MFVLAYEVELHIGHAQNLKAKRQVVRALLDGARHRFGVSAAEVGGQDRWQVATLGFAVVASSAEMAEAVIDRVDRFVWSRPDLEVVASDRRWLD